MSMDDSSVYRGDIERSKVVFSKYYEYLPYKRQNKESVVNVLYSRETGTSHVYRCHKPFKAKWGLSTRKNQWFYTRSLCAAKYGSCLQPSVYPITDVSGNRKEVDERLRPRQFEYHPSDPSLMAVGTLDGEVIVLNHETGSIVSCIMPSRVNSVLGLCWLKKQPSKILVGSDNGSLRLYDINDTEPKVEDSHCSSAVIFDDFEQLTSVHVNSIEDRCLTSGYSKKVAIYDISTGQCLHLITDLHREPINKPLIPCYSVTSSRGNVMVLFSPDDLYLLVSAVDNEVKQLLSVDGRLHTDFGIVSTGSAYNYTRSYYMNGRDYIISGSCEEPIIRVCCAHTGRRLRDISLEDRGRGSSIFVQSLRSDPFSHFHMAVLAACARPISKYKIIKINLLSSTHSAEEHQQGFNIAYSKGG